MTTVQQVVDATYRKLGSRPALNQENGAVNSSATSLTVTYDSPAPLPQPGYRLAVGLEDMHVWSTSMLTATVQRGVGGSTAAAHSDGDLVYVNPEYTPFEIAQTLNDVLAVLPGNGVVQFKTVDLTSNSVLLGYDLTSVTNLLRVHRVSWRRTGSEDEWVPIHRDRWRVEQKASTSDFASAEALFTHEIMDPGVTVRVLYQAPFTAVDALADDLETDAGVPDYAHHLLSTGCAYRLLLGRAPARSQMSAQGETRRADEVSASDSRTSLGVLYQEWLAGLASVKRDQLRKYGT